MRINKQMFRYAYGRWREAIKAHAFHCWPQACKLNQHPNPISRALHIALVRPGSYGGLYYSQGWKFMTPCNKWPERRLP